MTVLLFLVPDWDTSYFVFGPWEDEMIFAAPF
jgi:hypothetical protein